MAKSLSWKIFTENIHKKSLLLDVRSPGEFSQGAVPGAHNLPLFENNERAEVGTLYKESGQEAALIRGLEIVGPKLPNMVSRVKSLANSNKQVAVHCWRGGMRSASVAQLLETAGYEVTILKGGYKAYRQMVLDYFDEPKTFFVLGGRTGSGKTGILLAMKSLGAQVIDLEGLANHKGSAFGHVLEKPQPAQQNFEHALFDRLRACDPKKPIWLEDESVSIGKIYIPQPLWKQKDSAPVAVVEMSTERRLRQLVDDYADAPVDELEASLMKIQKRLGGQHVKAAQEALDKKDFSTAAGIALTYYDRAYDKGLERKAGQVRWTVDAGEKSFEEIAEEILEKAS
jgi:tRNA 2-selenouridine synthase